MEIAYPNEWEVSEQENYSGFYVPYYSAFFHVYMTPVDQLSSAELSAVWDFYFPQNGLGLPANLEREKITILHDKVECYQASYYLDGDDYFVYIFVYEGRAFMVTAANFGFPGTPHFFDSFIQDYINTIYFPAKK